MLAIVHWRLFLRNSEKSVSEIRYKSLTPGQINLLKEASTIEWMPLKEARKQDLRQLVRIGFLRMRYNRAGIAEYRLIKEFKSC